MSINVGFGQTSILNYTKYNLINPVFLKYFFTLNFTEILFLAIFTMTLFTIPFITNDKNIMYNEVEIMKKRIIEEKQEEFDDDSRQHLNK